MSLLSAVFAIIIAFPPAGSRQPPVTNCYVIGAVATNFTSVSVQGVATRVSPTGAFATRVPVKAGTNVLTVVAGDEATNHVFFVETPPRPKPSGAKPAAKKTYEKLPYALDDARPAPTNRAPGEITIVLDPGHGGPRDLGCRSPHDYKEKRANLLLAGDVRTALRRRGYRVEMTRTDDSAIQLYERARPAHSQKADAFVSIHYNAPAVDGDPNSRYSSVHAWNELGLGLARAIASRLDAGGDFPKARGAVHSNFAVTRSPEIASCLVEADFLTSPEGEARAFDRDSRSALAEAIACGISDWCSGLCR